VLPSRRPGKCTEPPRDDPAQPRTPRQRPAASPTYPARVTDPAPDQPSNDKATPPGRSAASAPAARDNRDRDRPLKDGEAVDPSLYLHPQTLARIGNFEMRAKMIVEGVMSGQHRSPYQGFSVEFAQHRPYVPGDALRHLDWKVYARTDRLQLKQYQQETNLDVILLVDSSGSMNYGTRSFEDASGEGRKTSLDGRSEWTKFDHATGVAAGIAAIALQQGDRAGLVVFADEIRSMVSRSSQRSAWRQIVTALATSPVDRETNIGRVMEQVLSKVNNKCLFILISDFFFEPERLRAALARVKHKGHDLVAFQVLDKSEREFTFSDAAPFEGLEGEPMLRVDPRAIRKSYLEALSSHIRMIRRRTRAFGFDHQLLRRDALPHRGVPEAAPPAPARADPAARDALPAPARRRRRDRSAPPRRPGTQPRSAPHALCRH